MMCSLLRTTLASSDVGILENHDSSAAVLGTIYYGQI